MAKQVQSAPSEENPAPSEENPAKGDVSSHVVENKPKEKEHDGEGNLLLSHHLPEDASLQDLIEDAIKGYGTADNANREARTIDDMIADYALTQSAMEEIDMLDVVDDGFDIMCDPRNYVDYSPMKMPLVAKGTSLSSGTGSSNAASNMEVVYSNEAWTRVILPFMKKTAAFLRLDITETVLEDIATEIMVRHQDSIERILNAVVSQGISDQTEDMLRDVTQATLDVDDQVTLVYFEVTRILRVYDTDGRSQWPAFLTEGSLSLEFGNHLLDLSQDDIGRLKMDPRKFRICLGF